MRRLASVLLAVSMAGGCVSNAPKSDYGGNVASWDRRSIRNVPGVCGPYGERVPMSAAAMNGPPSGKPAKTPIFGGPVTPQAPPPGMYAYAPNGMPMTPPNTIQQTAGYGPMGPVIQANHPMAGPPTSGGPSAAELAAMSNALPRFTAQRTQVRFVRPSGMKVSWFTQGPDGRPAYSNVPVEAPGRYNFPQGAIYRLKLSNIEARPGLEVYPTLEVLPTNPKTESFLAHSSVPIEFTADDFKHIAANSYVVKVIYLPDPQFQDAASTGTEELLSVGLDPGVDPIQEACRRGSILVIVRMGNVDEEAPNTPPLNATSPGGGANPNMNFGPTTSGGVPGSMVPFGPTGGGPGTPMPPGMKSAPGGLPPTISATPLPRTGSIIGMPASRPGRASVSSPMVPASPRTTPAPSLVPAAPLAPPDLPPIPSTLVAPPALD